MDLPALKHAESHLVSELFSAGGSAALDLQGRIIADCKPPKPLPNDLMMWLRLVQVGVVGGERGKLMLTEVGRAVAEKVLAGRTREAV